MNTSEIDNILRKYCKNTFLGVFALDKLPTRLPPRRPLLLVANTHPHYKSGEHWISIYIGSNHAEYFDSLARYPLKNFENFLDKFCTSWTYNDMQLQSVISSYCGHYCIMYCMLKNLDYSFLDIVSCFTNDTALNDRVAHDFVCHKLRLY